MLKWWMNLFAAAEHEIEPLLSPMILAALTPAQKLVILGVCHEVLSIPVRLDELGSLTSLVVVLQAGASEIATLLGRPPTLPPAVAPQANVAKAGA